MFSEIVLFPNVAGKEFKSVLSGSIFRYICCKLDRSTVLFKDKSAKIVRSVVESADNLKLALSDCEIDNNLMTSETLE